MSKCVWIKIYKIGEGLFCTYPHHTYETSCKSTFRHYTSFKFCPECRKAFTLDTKKHDQELKQWEKAHALKIQKELESEEFQQSSHNCMGGSDSLYNRRMSR